MESLVVKRGEKACFCARGRTASVTAAMHEDITWISVQKEQAVEGGAGFEIVRNPNNDINTLDNLVKYVKGVELKVPLGIGDRFCLDFDSYSFTIVGSDAVAVVTVEGDAAEVALEFSRVPFEQDGLTYQLPDPWTPDIPKSFIPKAPGEETFRSVTTRTPHRRGQL